MNPPLLFDQEQIRRQRNRKLAARADRHFLIDWNLKHITDRLHDIRKTYSSSLLLETRHSDSLVQELRNSGKIETLVTADDIMIDKEQLPFAASTFDLVISPFSLHALNDVPGSLIQMRRILKPDGLFLAAFPGGETLIELRQSFMEAEIECRTGVRARVHPCIEKQQAAALMQRAGFNLPVVDSETVTVTYEDAFSLMRDLRSMGEANALTGRSQAFTGKNLMVRMADIYRKKFSEPDGRIRATFEMIFLTGWAYHESQQKALRPGSAQSRLAAALGTEEKGTGEIARS